MRSATKTFVGLAGLGIIIAAAKAGMPLPDAASVVTENASSNSASPTPTPTATATATPTPKPTSTTKPKTTKPTKTKPKPTATATPTPPPVTSAAVTKTGGAINYAFGTMQVKVTKTGTNITDVTYLQSSYTRVPGGTLTYLVDASILANGSNFNKVSRATYTTNAYKQALESALAKF